VTITLAATRIFCLLSLMSILLVLISGCAKAPPPILPEPDEAGLLTAEQDFINGDFAAALLKFEKIYATAPVQNDRVVALYGIACTQMMLARTEAELATAIKTLQKWEALKGGAPFIENHHLLVLALKQQVEIISKRQIEAAQKELEEAQNEEKKNRLIANQKQKITQMANNVKMLQEQLKQLETIDETIQLKRTP
jgi:hypothetical protein